MRPIVCLLVLASALTPVFAQRPTTIAGCEQLLRRAPRDLQSSMCFAELVRMEGHERAPIVALLEGMVATRPDDPRPRIALGRVLQFKDSARAEALFRDAVSLAHQEGDTTIEGWARWRLFTQLAIQGRRAEAEEEAERCAETAELVDDAGLSANIGLERARMVGVQFSELSRAWNILSQLELDPRFAELNPSLRIEAWGLFTILALRLGLPEVAFEYASRAETLCEIAGTSKQLGETLTLKAQAALAANIPGFGRDRVLETAARALELNREARNTSGIFESRKLVAQLADDAEAWEHLKALEIEAAANPFGRHMLPIVWKEMARRMLTESPPRTAEALALLDAALEDARKNGSPRNEANALTDLARARLQTDTRDRAIASAMDAMTAIESLEDLQHSDTLGPRLFAARSGIYYLLVDYLLARGSDDDRRLAARVVERMHERGVESPLTTAEPHEALFSFVVPDAAADRSWLLVRTANGSRAYELTGPREIESAARFWLHLIEQRDRGEALAAAKVYDRLLDAALRDLPDAVEHLVVLPDGILHRIPFDALRPAPDAPPLALRYRVTVAPSLAALERLRGRPDGEGRPTALIVADPEPPQQGALPVEWRSGSYLGQATGRLPYARYEGRRAMDALRLGELLIGSEATEAAIKHGAAEARRLIHFAAHAVIDMDRPERSAILLSPGGTGEDGLLQAEEISTLDLDGAAVVLSACSSAGGLVLAGEGVMGLARSFFQAGARSVIGGLWPLRDRETAELMEVFYGELIAGKPLDAALVSAKREMIGRGRPTAAWAGLVVLGAGDSVTWPARRSAWKTVGTILLALGTLAAIGFAWRRSA